MSQRDLYEILGVQRDADAATLKSAYRKLAMKLHPDRNPDDDTAEAQFKEVNAAYEMLKDPQKRAAYDRMGHAAFQNGGAGGFNGDFGASMADIFDDLFGDFMGGRRGGGRQNNRRGADLRYNMEITLEDAYSGKAAEIRVPSSSSCETCGGNGAKPGTGSSTCQGCGGAGRVRASQGFFSIERTCPRCGGTGETIDTPCDDCGGAGRVTRERTLSLNIPAGVEDGTRIRLSGEGDAGLRGAPAGDLYIFLSVKPHEIFQRDGADLFCRAPISFTQAALGGSLEVPTLDGKSTQVKIPAGTQTGSQIRLSAKGMPVLRSRQAGDLYVQTIVETPVKLSRKQKDLLREFDEASSDENTPDAHGFISRVKDFFQGRADE
ncbi:molecular chaperone DnaJ [Tepidamorphus sp. 3E244]|uniref:molecular chaperone DnaJ n=1 Tax=Tepidamorphus sp. 3E244 TaxID=3385498 RepID=UPI0038FC7069